MVTCPEIVPPWWQWHPPVGVFIAILAVLGVLVPWFRGGDALGRKEKALWTILMFVLVLLEIHSIYSDQAEHDREQALARCQQLVSFQAIAKGIDQAIQSSQQQFSATMARSDSILRSQNEALNTATGGDSFCYIDLLAGSPDGGMPIAVQHGKYPLYDVTAQIVNLAEFDRATSKPNALLDPRVTHLWHIGDLAPGSALPESGVKLPFAANGKVDFNIFFSSTRSGFWIENLKLRRVNNNWAVAMRVFRQRGKRKIINLMRPTIDKNFPVKDLDWLK
jgi:hypothetical protein